MTKKHEKELVDTNTAKPIGRVWWNAEKERIEATNSHVYDMLKKGHSGANYEGEELVKNLGKLIRNGYITVRSVNEGQ